MNDDKKFTRECPQCKIELTYKTKYLKNRAIKLNWICRSCSASNRDNTNKFNKVNEDVKSGKRLNGFANKTHSIETIQKMQQLDKSYTQTKKFKDTMNSVALRGSDNPMYGKSFYEIWIEKYGILIADKKMAEFKNKISIANSGENNPMYGKASPMGSGNGWSGWYNGWFFRSLHELSYVINICERFNLKWKTAESNEYKIKYIGLDGQKRTYKADFIISNKYLVEIKPKVLHNSKLILLKTEAGIKFCNENNLIYKITSCKKLTDVEIKELILSGKVKLTDRYKIKFNEKYMKIN